MPLQASLVRTIPLALCALAPLAGCASSATRADRAVDLDYALVVAGGDAPSLTVELACAGEQDGVTEFTLGEGWGGVEGPTDDVREWRAFGDGGRTLEVASTDERVWRVVHAPSEGLRVRYRFDSNENGRSLGGRDHYRAIVRPGLVHAIGANALVRPTTFGPDEVVDVRLAWSGLDGAGWRARSSFSASEEPWSQRIELGRFLHAVFVAGDLECAERTVHGRPVHVARAGGGWSFTIDELADLCARIVALEREFFDDYDYEHYLISMIPVGAEAERSYSIGGTCLTNSFATFVSPGVDLEAEGPAGGQLQRVLAHEMFHHWNGTVVTLAQPEELAYWCSEGFTDFFTRRLLLRGGLIDREQYVAMLNERIAEYSLSPVADAPASRVRERFWSDRDIQALPYSRGDVIAMWVDACIRERSGGARSLDDWMRELVAIARERKQPFTQDEIFAHVERFTDASTASAVRAVAVDGAIAPIAAEWFAPCLAMTREPRGSFDLGFDFEASKQSGEIRGVRADSRAYASGLREGQRFLGGSISFGDARQPVALRVGEGDVERDVSYLPVGATRDVAAFAIAAEADCAAL